MSFEFLTKHLNIPVERLAVTVFVGNELIPFDEVSYNKWLSLGIKKERIAKTVEDNFWIAGASGPCGPDTEIFYFRSNDEIPENFDPEDERWVEIWNNVFMQYFKDEAGNVTELPKKNVDTGMGVERVTAILEGVNDNYKSSIWSDVIDLISKLTNLPYEGNEESMRIIADHIRTAVFISADPAGIKPSNTDQGYILRRLIRRMTRHLNKLQISLDELGCLIDLDIEILKEMYPDLDKNKDEEGTKKDDDKKEKSIKDDGKKDKKQSLKEKINEKNPLNKLKKKVNKKVLNVAIFMTFGALIIFSLEMTNNFKRQKNLVQDEYNKSMYLAVSYINNVEVDLAKLLVTSTPKMSAVTLADIWKQANLAKECLEQIPVGQNSMANASKYLTQVSDFSYTLMKQNISDIKLTEEEYEKLKHIYEDSSKLSSNMSDIYDDLNAGRIKWDELKDWK